MGTGRRKTKRGTASRKAKRRRSSARTSRGAASKSGALVGLTKEEIHDRAEAFESRNEGVSITEAYEAGFNDARELGVSGSASALRQR